MAPIDPNQLLAAFAPLLTPTGGIKNATEVPRLSSLMKKFSRKLVSRCVYCNVLLATSPDVLEEFLKSGGWETIHLWIKSAKELGNKPFLDELLKLLMILPMNVERLRENDSPKIIKTLSKSEDLVLAQKARQVVEKWTKMIESASGAKEGTKDHKKKRKKDSIDGTNSDSNSKDSSVEPKKPKLTANALDVNTTDVSYDSIKEDMKAKPVRTPRPATAKVKPGKSRLDGLVTSQANAEKSKARKETQINSNTKKPNPNASNKSLNTSSADSQNTSSNSLSSKAPKVKSQPIDIKPTETITAALPPPTSSPTTVTAPPAPVVPKQPVVPHVLQDSNFFMDALIAPPTQTKKKRRMSASTSSKDGGSANSSDSNGPVASTSSPKASSPPKPFSFYKDMIDEKVDQRVGESNTEFNVDNETNDSIESDSNSALRDEEQNDDSNGSDLNEEEANHMDIDITVPDIKTDATISLTSPLRVISDTSSKNKIKPILCYIKKGSKKSVRWVDDNKLQTIKYFELDETERVNVTRPPGAGGIGDIKRFDMKHEAQFMLRARQQSANSFDLSEDYLNRVQTFSPWKLIVCDGDTNLIEVGKDSKERHIQLERMRTTLETFYSRTQMPDSPIEPDPELYVPEAEPMKTIPLEDENNPNNVHDFSNIDLPEPKTGEQLPPRVPDFKAIGFAPIGAPPFTPVANQPMMQGAPNFGGQPMIPQFGSGPQILAPPGEAFAVRPSGPGPQQQFFAPNNGPPFQQWSDSGPGPRGGPPPPHFVPPFSNGPSARSMGVHRPSRLPRNAQNTICRHYARTGKCRFQPKCNFLHSNDR